MAKAQKSFLLWKQKYLKVIKTKSSQLRELIRFNFSPVERHFDMSLARLNLKNTK